MGNFDNDAARNWLATFEAEGAAAVDRAFTAVAQGFEGGSVPAATGQAGLAAAEAVAAARGKPDPGLAADTAAILERHAGAVRELPAAQARAIETIEYITVDPDRSELLAAAVGGSEAEAMPFLGAVAGLHERLG